MFNSSNYINWWCENAFCSNEICVWASEGLLMFNYCFQTRVSGMCEHKTEKAKNEWGSKRLSSSAATTGKSGWAECLRLIEVHRNQFGMQNVRSGEVDWPDCTSKLALVLSGPNHAPISWINNRFNTEQKIYRNWVKKIFAYKAGQRTQTDNRIK